MPELFWDWDSHYEISNIKPPELLMGVRKDLLQGDIYIEWFRWIVEQFIEREYLHKAPSFPFVFESIHKEISVLVGMQISDEQKIFLSKHISRLVIDRVSIYHNKKSTRKAISLETKLSLLDIYGKKPRCWLTGYQFTDEAIFNFTEPKSEHLALKLPVYVDRLRPIGLNERDISIEVDHLHPFSQGGADDIGNYRLACGWANKIKSDSTTGYSAAQKHISMGSYSSNGLYYWVLRLIGLRRKCEHPGCNKTIEHNELRVRSSLGKSKLINPLNMQVVCEDHDDLDDRYILASKFKEFVL